jgi:hypothetical protein
MLRAVPLFVLAGCTTWSHRDVALHGALFVATSIDWQQTIDITVACHENNPIMGQCGQRVPVGAYFPLVLVTQAAFAAVIPPSWRGTFQGFLLGAETSTVYWNAHTKGPPAR